MRTFSEIVTFIDEVEKERAQSIKEVASWDNPKLKKTDRDTISCDDDERYERVPIRNAVNRLYPGIFTKEEIESAINACCKKYNQTRERQGFYTCVLNRLLEDLD